MVEPSGVSDSILVHSFRKAYLYQLCASYVQKILSSSSGAHTFQEGVVNVFTGPCNSGTSIALEGSI